MASFDEVIPPGQVGKVVAAVKTEGMAPGTVNKVVAVSTDDPGRQNFTLILRANIVTSVDFLPTRALFVPAGPAAAGTGKLVVRKNETEKGELRVSDIAANVPWLKVSARKVESPESPPSSGAVPAQPGDWVVEAKIEGDPPAGQVTAEIRFKTGLPREPEITFPVTVRTTSPITFSAPMVYLPYPGEPPQPQRQTVYVRVEPPLDPNKLTVEATPAAFEAVANLVGPTRVRVDVTWTPAGESTPRDGTVTAKLGTAIVSVPVKVNPKAAPIVVNPTPSPAPASVPPAAPVPPKKG
ncbi:MAG: hypothetical protein LAO51_08415 [Acidobacteriia bacterium]|nr:hypothetical protein [Terriglobia bacterium]